MSLNNQRFSSEKTKSLRDLFGGNLTEEARFVAVEVLPAPPLLFMTAKIFAPLLSGVLTAMPVSS